jgi:hypothetical protein
MQITTRIRAIFMAWSPGKRYITAMMTNPSQDPKARAQAQAEWRTLKRTRAAAAVVLMTVLVVGGIVALGTGHERSGLAALVIGGTWAVGAVLGIVGRTLRTRRSGN